MGRANIRLSTDMSKGHGGWPPTLPIQASTNVFVNGRAEVRTGDSYAVHCNSKPSCHAGKAMAGSSNVYVNGRLSHTQGAGISCGDTASNGSPDTFTG